MKLAACTTLRTFYIGFFIGFRSIGSSLRAELLPAAPLLFVVGTLAAIVVSHSLRQKKNQEVGEDNGRSSSRRIASRPLEPSSAFRLARSDRPKDDFLPTAHPSHGHPERSVTGQLEGPARTL